MKKLKSDSLFLSYFRDEPPVVQGICVTLSPGEFVGIVGPNGSGKSTLIRAMSRVLVPDKGVVLLDGRNLYSAVTARQSAQSIATLPQATTIAFDFTVREIVEMGRTPHQPSSPFARVTGRDRDAVEDAMRQTGVSNLADRIASTLSGGEQQRVLLARALAQDPTFLLLDEPTAHLDLHHQASMLRLARDLSRSRPAGPPRTGIMPRKAAAVLAVLHDLNLAAAYCDRLLLMSGGGVIAEGTPSEVLTESLIHQAYGARVWVRCHPVSGRPFVLDLPETTLPKSKPHPNPLLGKERGPDESEPLAGVAVHVICGGGMGAGLMHRLRQAGCAVTAGILNVGDTDQEAAEMLGISYVSEAPFTAFSEEAVTKAQAFALAADAVVIADVPFGPANLAGLRMAVGSIEQGKMVFALSPDDRPFAGRDFTGGVATGLWETLLLAGMRTSADIESLLGLLIDARG